MAEQEKLTVVQMIKEDGKVWGYGLSDGRRVNRDEGVALAKQGMLKDVTVAKRTETEYLRSLPDDNSHNNLGALPVVELTD